MLNMLQGLERYRTLALFRSSIWTVTKGGAHSRSGHGGRRANQSLDREVKPGREVRVGLYTSMRADCTAGPLIRLSVAPEHGTVTVRRATNVTIGLNWR